MDRRRTAAAGFSFTAVKAARISAAAVAVLSDRKFIASSFLRRARQASIHTRADNCATCVSSKYNNTVARTLALLSAASLTAKLAIEAGRATLHQPRGDRAHRCRSLLQRARTLLFPVPAGVRRRRRGRSRFRRHLAWAHASGRGDAQGVHGAARLASRARRCARRSSRSTSLPPRASPPRPPWSGMRARISAARWPSPCCA